MQDSLQTAGLTEQEIDYEPAVCRSCKKPYKKSHLVLNYLCSICQDKGVQSAFCILQKLNEVEQGAMTKESGNIIFKISLLFVADKTTEEDPTSSRHAFRRRWNDGELSNRNDPDEEGVSDAYVAETEEEEADFDQDSKQDDEGALVKTRNERIYKQVM